MPLTPTQELICAAFADTCVTVGASLAPTLSGVQVAIRIGNTAGRLTIAEGQVLVSFADAIAVVAAVLGITGAQTADRFVRAVTLLMRISLIDETDADLMVQARSTNEAGRQSILAQRGQLATQRDGFVVQLLNIAQNG